MEDLPLPNDRLHTTGHTTLTVMNRRLGALLAAVLWVAVSPGCIDEEGGQAPEVEEETVEEAEEIPEAADPVGLEGPAASLELEERVDPAFDRMENPYTGPQGATFLFEMANYPLTWAIATVHASMLLQSRDIAFGPNALIAYAVRESRLQCATGRGKLFLRDGCFQIEPDTAYTELQQLFPTRFGASHSLVISGDAFETSALAFVHYALFSKTMFYLYHTDPWRFVLAHPDPYAEHQMLSASFNRGPWWVGLGRVFEHCEDERVIRCFIENGRPHHLAIDYARSVAHYAAGLNEQQPFEAEVTLQDLHDYWDEIKILYPEADDDAIRAVLEVAFERLAGPQRGESISFNKQLANVLEELIQALPKVPEDDAIAYMVCKRGYMAHVPPCSPYRQARFQGRYLGAHDPRPSGTAADGRHGHAPQH